MPTRGDFRIIKRKWVHEPHKHVYEVEQYEGWFWGWKYLGLRFTEDSAVQFMKDQSKKDTTTYYDQNGNQEAW